MNACHNQTERRRKRRRAVRRSSGRRCGATAVEFAIAAPIFFVFAMAAFEFGRLNVIRHTADNAAYEAARYAMVPGASSSDALAKADSIMRTVGTRGARIAVSPPVIDSSVEQITVTVDVPLDQNGWITPKFTASRSIQASCTLQTERAEN
ncbi:MAG: TadE family protein [Planctomycetota bacterium]